MSGVELEPLLQFLDGYLDVAEFPDYPNALNGLQLAGPTRVERVCAAVDASEASISAALSRGADLLLVHHGLFWEGLRPITGRLHRRIAPAVEGKLGVYAAHLPLDAHPEVGNCAVLARELGMAPEERFGEYRGAAIGWTGSLEMGREDFLSRVEEVVGGAVRLIPGGPETLRRVAVLTGGGGSFVAEAARSEVDALVTGEGTHHTYFDAVELGVNVYFAGHYATEVWGVRALAEEIERRFAVPWEFLDFPTGL